MQNDFREKKSQPIGDDQQSDQHEDGRIGVGLSASDIHGQVVDVYGKRTSGVHERRGLAIDITAREDQRGAFGKRTTDPENQANRNGRCRSRQQQMPQRRHPG